MVPASPRPKMPTRLQGLDSLRGCAALSVVFLHYVTLLDGSPKYGARITEAIAFARKTPLNIFWSGNQAVILFFILSGYVLTKMIRQAPNLDPRNNLTFYSAYLTRRWVRLWPVYAVTILFAVGLLHNSYGQPHQDLNLWINSFFSSRPTPAEIFEHFTFIWNFDTSKLNFPIWSLVQEMRASILFPVLLYFIDRFGIKRNLLFFSLLSVVAVVLGHLAKNSIFSNYREMISFFHYIFFFVVGACIHDSETDIAIWFKRTKRLHLALALLFAMVVYGYSAELPKILHLRFGMTIHWIMLPSAIFMIICAIHSTRIFRVMNHGALRFLGKISYSLYVWHGLLLTTWVAYFSSSMSTLPFFLSLFLVTMVTATLSERYIEAPSTTLSRLLHARVASVR